MGDFFNAGPPSHPAGDAPDAMESFCVLMAKKNCDAMQNCCIDKGVGYDQMGCEGEFLAGCREAANMVRLGGALYHEIPYECFEGAAEIFDQCEYAPFAERVWRTRYVFQNCLAFEGDKQTGEKCSASYHCAQPTHDNEWAFCDANRGVCRKQRLYMGGEVCDIGDLCQPGYYCDAIAPGLQGSCVEVIPLGETCDALRPYDRACGHGAYCDKETAVCAVPWKLPGDHCESGYECISEFCDPRDQQCRTAMPEITPHACTGVGPKI